jgi:hypothetical protein
VALTAREKIIGERRIGADKYVIAESDTIPNLNAALEGNSIADTDIIFNEYMVADIAIFTDVRVGQEVCECPNSGSLPDMFSFHYCMIVHEHVTHNPLRLKEIAIKQGGSYGAIVGSFGRRWLSTACHIHFVDSLPVKPVSLTKQRPLQQ